MTGTFAGFSRGDLEALLQPITISDEASEGDAVMERFARAALSTAVEPGDVDAGLLIGGLGARSMLHAVVEDWSAARVVDRLRGTASSGNVSGVADVWGTPPGAQSGMPTLAGLEHPDTGREALETRVGAALARWRPRLAMKRAARALEAARHIHSTLLTPESPLWPSGLRSLGAGEPLVLWARGDARRTARLSRSLALVGARAASGYGEHVALEAAAGLSDRGLAVVSGGAYGIDGAAHRATLASGGLTVAFLAGGPDRLYPAGHAELLRRIATDGLLMAELPCGSAPTRWRFLMRNRLIAAASTATVVVEAGRRSGSLNTAGHAAELGRPLGAVPGPITSPTSAGCHRLIREYDATCVTTVDEMVELVEPFGSEPLGTAGDAEGSPSADPAARVLAELRRAGGAAADDIARGTGLRFAEVSAALGRLAAEGAVTEQPDGWRAERGKR